MNVIRKILPYTSILVLIALCYAGWTFWSRNAENRRLQQQAQARETSRDAQVTRELGGGSLKIIAFYASPPVVKPGGKALVCYGVVNARTVEIAPHIDDLKPSMSRCLEVRLNKDTDYKLTASDAAGHQASQSIALRVAR